LHVEGKASQGRTPTAEGHFLHDGACHQRRLELCGKVHVGHIVAAEGGQIGSPCIAALRRLRIGSGCIV